MGGYPPYARGSYAFGYCDVCDQRYDLRDLKPVIYNMMPTGMLACPECNDEDNPQLYLGKFPVSDPQALRNPRPDIGLEQSRSFFGWQPVWNPLHYLTAHVGTVTTLITNIAPPSGIDLAASLGTVTAVGT